MIETTGKPEYVWVDYPWAFGNPSMPEMHESLFTWLEEMRGKGLSFVCYWPGSRWLFKREVGMGGEILA